MMDWHKKFRKKDTFPHPNSKIQLNRKYSPPILEFSPEAGELICDWATEQIQKETLTRVWKHETCPTIFALCVDDFTVKYFSDDDAEHIINTLKNYYPISVDHDGKKILWIGPKLEL